MQKKILILTASIGSGHTRAAEAIAASLQKHKPEYQINIVDFMDSDISLLHYLMKRIYLIMLSFVPNIYDVCFKVAGSSSGGGLVRNAFAVVMTRAMNNLVKKYRPDIIVATHPFPEGAAARWRANNSADYLLVALMTDYTIHEIWLSQGVDNYFVATTAMKQAMEKHGFNAERVLVTGIPILYSVNEDKLTKSDLRAKLNISEDSRVILIMGGGLGLGGMKRALLSLDSIKERLTLLIVAGSNNELRRDVEQKSKQSHHDIRVWGYTDNIHELMQTADLLITKPGALTLSEAFVYELPLLLHDPIPGPETENARFATKHGVAEWLHRGEKIAPAVTELLVEDKLAKMRKSAGKVATPEAADTIAQHIIAMLSV